MPSSTIFASTALRRRLAAGPFLIGEYADGACGRPASSAASCRSSCLARLLKYTRAAASAPIAVCPPTVPYGVVLRYLVRSHSFECSFSSSSASFASRILRW